LRKLQILFFLVVLLLIQSACQNNKFSSNQSSTSANSDMTNTPAQVTNDSKKAKLALHNSDIISDEKSSSLTIEQKEFITQMDDYEYFYNKHVNPGNKYNYVEGQVPFGEGYITIKVTSVPELYDVNSCDIRANVEVKKNVMDSKTTLKGNYAFRFIKDTSGVWRLSYWWL
jgi:hypothetical protein